MGDSSPGSCPTEAALYAIPRLHPHRIVQASLDSTGRGNQSLSSREALSLLSKPFLVIKVTLAKFPRRRHCSRNLREGRRGPGCMMSVSLAKQCDFPELASVLLLVPAEEP